MFSVPDPCPENDPGGSSMEKPCTDTSLTVQKVRQIYKDCGDKGLECAQVIQKQFTDFQKVDTESLRKKIVKTMKIAAQKLKSNAKDKNTYMASEFFPPKSQGEKLAEQLSPRKAAIARKLQQKTKQLVVDHKATKRQYAELEKDYETLDNQLTTLETKYDIALNVLGGIQERHENAVNEIKIKSQEQFSELQEWERKYSIESEKVSSLAVQLQEARQKVSRYCPRNVNKRERRSKDKIDNLEQNLKEQESQLQDEKAKSEAMQIELNELKENARKLSADITNLKKQKTRAENKINTVNQSNSADMDVLQAKLNSYNERIEELEYINSILDSDEFSSQIRECVMTLSGQHGVSLKNMNNVIKTVLSNLSGKLATKLPSHGTLCRIMHEAKFVANRQVADEMLRATDLVNRESCTLHNDGTTKHHREFESYQTTLPDGRTLSMGLKEVSSQSAEKNFESFKDVMKNLTSAMELGNQKIQAQLITSLQTTMSDLGAANPLFFDMINSLRKDLLPIAVENWDNLSEGVKENVSTMANYYCKLHLLGNFESNIIKTATDFEANICQGRNPYAFHSESCGTQRLAKNASRALHNSGSARSGKGGLWKAYTQKKGFKDYIINIIHERINTTFYQGGAVYHHRNDITDFLATFQEKDKNDLTRCLEFDVTEKVYLSSCRAFGILDKVVFGPFWRLCNASKSILEMTPHLEVLQSSLVDWSENASQLMSKDFVLFPTVDVHKDGIYESLYEQNELESDPLTKLALELYSQQCLIILERQGKDQLPGGKYYIPDENIKDISKAVPSTNVCSERDFAMLDWMMRYKPHATTMHYSTLMQWKNNKTAEYLGSLPVEEKKKLLTDARKSAPRIFKEHKEAEKKLKAEKIANLQEKQLQKEKKEEATAVKAVLATNKLVQYGGVWGSPQEVDDKCKEYRDNKWTEKQIFEAVYSQIIYFRDVVKAKGKRELYQKTSKKKAKPLDEMIANLKSILELNSIEIEDDDNKLQYFPIEEAEKNIENSKKGLLSKLQKERIQRLCSKQKAKAKEYIENPHSLVGKNVRHLIQDPGDDPFWCDGEVRSITKLDGEKTKFAIKYINFPQEGEWIFPLLKDMAKGDLLVQGDTY